MSYLGMAENVAKAAFEPTPDEIARLCPTLLAFPVGEVVALDPTFGLGALAKPFVELPNTYVFGAEIAGDRAKLGQEAVPQAKVYHTDVLRMEVSSASVSLLLSNPPYLEQDARRLEYHIYHHIFKRGWLIKDGIAIAILAMRQWKHHIIDLWARYCYDIRAFKLPDPEFSRFTQGLIIARMREKPLAKPDLKDIERMRGWYYDNDRAKEGKQPWRQGYPLPELPDRPGVVTYPVPAVSGRPVVTLKKASSDMVLEVLKDYGVHKSPEWRDATTYDIKRLRLLPPLMPLIGKAHLAALILTGILDGRVLKGPGGRRYIFSSFITTKWEESPIDDEERMKNVVKKRQLQDLPILGVLDCESGETSYYHGARAYKFLDPWLPLLARLVLKEHRPRYDLSNFEPWMLREVARIGIDKQLPGAKYPGLAIAQLHRVFAHWIAFNALGKDGFQGEPGTGKTRMLIALMALMAHYWQRRDDPAFLAQQGTKRRPRWVKGVRTAWRASAWTKGDAPKALPLAVVTPKRVIKSTWEGEFARAWPQAKTIVIHTHRDVKQWMDLCADGFCYETDATGKRVKRTFPAVAALFSQSKTRPSRLQWLPAVIEVPAGTKVVPDLAAEGEPVYDGIDKLIGKRDPKTGEIITKQVEISNFYCPDCRSLIEATPRSLMKQSVRADVDEEALEEIEAEEQRPVESIEWFEQQPRWCQNVLPEKERRGRQRSRKSEQVCGAALWTMRRIDAIEKKSPQVPFAVWVQGVEAKMARAGKQTGTVRGRQGASGKAAHLLKENGADLPSRYSRILTADGVVGEALPESFSPYDYYAHFYGGCCAFVGIDESHNAQAQNSHIARAIHHIMQAGQTRMLASGTHYPGTLERFFYYWFRFDPAFWMRLGISWKMVRRAIREYGVMVQTTKERTVVKRGLAEKEVSISTKAAPGVSTRLLPLLLALMCYIDVLDVGAYMPRRRQIPVIIDMHDEELESRTKQARSACDRAAEALDLAEAVCDELAKTPEVDEAEIDRAEFDLAQALGRVQVAQAVLRKLEAVDLASGYEQVVDELMRRARKGNSTAQMMLGMLPRWWVIYPFAPAFTITQNNKGEWGEDVGSEVIFTAPTLEEDYEYPLERAVRERVDAELSDMAEGSNPPRQRRVMIYYEQTTKRNIGARYARILKDYTPWILPDDVEPEDREDAIRAAVEAGHQVVLVAYKKVSEGLNLQFLDTIMWVEMPMNLILFDQAGRRLWRLGKVEEVREYIFVYAGTVAHEKMKRLASESGAASLFMGNSPVGELAALVGADQTALAQVARKLDNAQDLVAAFAARDKEREAILALGREWLGVEAGDPLPDQYERARAEIDAESQAIREAEHIVREGAGPAEKADDGRQPNPQDQCIGLPRQREQANAPTWLELALHLEQEQKEARKRKQQEKQKRREGRSEAKEPKTEVFYVPSLNAEDDAPTVSVSMMMDLWGEMRPTSSDRGSRGKAGRAPRFRK